MENAANNSMNDAMTFDLFEALVQAATQAAFCSYSPYSKFRVGAAILAGDDKIYSGTNIENASYGLTICAERVAASQAIMNKQQSFQALAIVAKGIAMPCGACRQFLSEWGVRLPIVIVDLDTLDIQLSVGKDAPLADDVKARIERSHFKQASFTDLSQLLPRPFGPGVLS